MEFEYNITNKHYHTIDFYLKSKYQKKVFKVPLNASFTCPNRDGSKGINGCAFCSNKGSGDFAGNPQESLLKQFADVKENISKKWENAYYIAYFQAFSNTYGSIEKIKNNLETFINKKDIIGMSIATRCDCIDENIVEYLKSIKHNFKEFWVELGLQTSKKQTMKAMNLCYDTNDFKKAVKLLRKANIDIIVHIIDGLPHESQQDMINTINFVNKLDIQGIKIHCLNVIKNTKIASMYEQKKFKVISQEEYIKTIAKQIATLKENVIIHRLGADSSSDDLIAPTWISKKLSLIDKIDEYLDEHEIFQGDLTQ